jgi:excisionase family DNA binding protein
MSRSVLNIAKTSVYDLITKRHLAHFRIGRLVRVREDDLSAFLSDLKLRTLLSRGTSRRRLAGVSPSAARATRTMRLVQDESAEPLRKEVPPLVSAVEDQARRDDADLIRATRNVFGTPSSNMVPCMVQPRLLGRLLRRCGGALPLSIRRGPIR